MDRSHGKRHDAPAGNALESGAASRHGAGQAPASPGARTDHHAGISRLRILATIGVICIHTFSTIYGHPELFSPTEAQMRFITAGDLIWRWTVPVFFMITGALLLKPEKRIPYSDCIGKYCKRTVLALVIFGIPFAALTQYYEGVRGGALIWKSVSAMLTGESFVHLWYLYTLTGLYLILPILKAFTEKAGKREMECALAALFLFAFIIPRVNRSLEWDIAFYIPVEYPVFYLLAGFYAMHHMKAKRLSLLWCGIVLVTALFVVLSYTDPDLREWAQYDSPLTAIEAMLFFLAFKEINGPCSDRLWRVDRLCFSAYLIHPVIIFFFYRYLKITPLSVGDNCAFASIGFIVLFTVCAFAGGWVLNRIKPLREHVL